MKLRPFERCDFDGYRSWYEDDVLNFHLGPMDVEWLDFVMKQNPILQYSFFDNEELVVVIGVEEPEPSSKTWYITDIATKPTLRRQGYSRKSLLLLVEHFKSMKPAPEKWVAWVAASNDAARRFFKSLGWSESKQPDAENLFQFTFEVVQ